MPELPEVETVRRGLIPLLEGRLIHRLVIADPCLVRPRTPRSVAAQVRGERISHIGRRGKYLIIHTGSGLVLLHHLRMTGAFASTPVTHVRAEYHLESDIVVRYRDPRRFGTLGVMSTDQADEFLDARLGPEPLGPGFTPRVLRNQLAGRTASIKAALLNQKVLAGLGNIYVDEALFLSRIAPQQPAGTLTLPQLRRLHAAIVSRLEEAIDAQGSTLRDYRTVAGSEGGMQERFTVYGRAGEPCVTCGSALSAGRVAGRGTTWCPRCQRSLSASSTKH